MLSSMLASDVVYSAHHFPGTAKRHFPSAQSAGSKMLVLNRVYFENRGYVGPQPGKAPTQGASGPNCQTTVSKLDAVWLFGCEIFLALSASRRALMISQGPARPEGLALA